MHHVMCSCKRKYKYAQEIVDGELTPPYLLFPKTIDDCEHCSQKINRLRCTEIHDGIMCMRLFSSDASLKAHKAKLLAKGVVSKPAIVTGGTTTGHWSIDAEHE
jgi:hypothetical protein